MLRLFPNAMPFLEAADEVVVISAKEDKSFEPSGDDLAEYLLWHGIQASVVTADSGPASPR